MFIPPNSGRMILQKFGVGTEYYQQNQHIITAWLVLCCWAFLDKISKVKFENNDWKWTKLWLPSEGRAWVQVPWDGSRESSWCWCTSSLSASRSLLWVSSPPAGSTGTLAWCRNTHRTAIYIQKNEFQNFTMSLKS